MPMLAMTEKLLSICAKLCIWYFCPEENTITSCFVFVFCIYFHFSFCLVDKNAKTILSFSFSLVKKHWPWAAQKFAVSDPKLKWAIIRAPFSITTLTDCFWCVNVWVTNHWAIDNSAINQLSNRCLGNTSRTSGQHVLDVWETHHLKILLTVVRCGNRGETFTPRSILQGTAIHVVLIGCFTTNDHQ